MRNFSKFTLSLMVMLLVTTSIYAWKFTLASPAEGKVESLGYITLKAPAGTSFVDEPGAVPCMMQKNGTDLKNWNLADAFSFDGTVAGSAVDYADVKDDGVYTLVIPAGAFHINGAANEAQTFTWTIGEVTGGGGNNDNQDQNQDKGVTILEKGVTEVAASDFTLTKDGVTLTMLTTGTAYVQNNFKPYVDASGLHVWSYQTFQFSADKNIKKIEFTGPTLSVKSNSVAQSTFSNNTWEGSATAVDLVFSTTNMIITKIVVTLEGDSKTDPEVDMNYTLAYDKTSGRVSLTWAEDTELALTPNASYSIDGFDGTLEFNVGPSGDSFTDNMLYAYASGLTEGSHDLTIAAGSFTINGVPNTIITDQIVVGGSAPVEGEPWSEVIFETGTAFTQPYTKETDGVSISSIGRPFLDTTIDIRYNTNGNKEMNWPNGVQMVFTAKDNITGIIFTPNADSKSAINYVEADKGSYTAGVWEGTLLKGETLTLKSNDGINLDKVVVLYNGADVSGEQQEEIKGEVIINWPADNSTLTSISDGAKFCTFTTNKEYAQVIIELRNNDPRFREFDFPTRMVDNAGERSDNLHVGENTITVATPSQETWYSFDGDSYTMTVKAYVNMWDNYEDYDAIAEINIIGTGKPHEKLSNAKLISITPDTRTELNNGTTDALVSRLTNNEIFFEFDAPIGEFKAYTAGGMGGAGTSWTTSKVNEEGTIWKVTINGQDINLEGNEGTLTFDITAKDTEGGVVILNENRSDFGLALFFEVVNQEVTQEDQKVLGAPAFNIADGTEDLDAESTTSVRISFPNASGFPAESIAIVAGSLVVKGQGTPVEFANVQGTLANGVEIPVELEAGESYTLTVNQIDFMANKTIEGETSLQAVGTYSGEWTTSFSTVAAGYVGIDYLGDAQFAADESGIIITWPNANLEEIAKLNDAAIYIAGIDVNYGNGNTYNKYPDPIVDFQNIKVEIPYSELGTWDADYIEFTPYDIQNGEELSINILAGNITLEENVNDYLNSKVVYKNNEEINGTVNAVVSALTKMTLGTAQFSIAAGATIAYGTSTIQISFPNATGAEGYFFMAYGQMYDMDMNTVPVAAADDNFGIFGEQPATFNISTAPAKSYTLLVTKVVIYNEEAEPVKTFENLSEQIYFFTEGDDPDPVEFTATPAADSEVKVLDKVVIKFNDNSSIGAGKITIKKDGEVLKQVEAESIFPESFSDPVLEHEINNLQITEAGVYTFEIPTGYFMVGGNDAPAFTITYTVTGGIIIDPSADYMIITNQDGEEIIIPVDSEMSIEWIKGSELNK